mmetsp:Transcript_4492/g.6726  ORF Transcript_4492/g.6726 Transcript_4492/m.6726 type:complete len:95 (+) Transcript_4492:374-658(+)
MKRDQQNQDNVASNYEDKSIEEEDTEESYEHTEGLLGGVIFQVEKLSDHVRYTCTALISVQGTFLALDKMMMQCCEHSLETHQMKNTPIGEECK